MKRVYISALPAGESCSALGSRCNAIPSVFSRIRYTPINLTKTLDTETSLPFILKKIFDMKSQS